MPRVDTVEVQSALVLPFPGEAAQRPLSGASGAVSRSSGASADRLPPGQAVLLIVTVSGALWAVIAASVIWLIG